MPTYEYRCPDGHEFTRFYKTISAGVSEIECPECGKMGQRQLSGGAGLVFKGSGFYLTDYGKNAHRTGGASKPSASTDSKGESKADSGKSETKSETPKSDSGTKSEAPKAESKPAPKAKPE